MRSLRRAKGRSRPDVLAHALKRRLVERYGGSVAGRIGAEGALSALGFLLRRHPRVALEMAAAGLLGAGRRSAEEISAWRDERQAWSSAGAAAAPRVKKRGRRLTKAERRRLIIAVSGHQPDGRTAP